MREPTAMASEALRWNVLEQGSGRVDRDGGALRLTMAPTGDRVYSNAQIGDPRSRRRWSPPLTLTLRARFNAPRDRLRGTAGFGFWNSALSPGQQGLHLPRAAWFFLGAPPYDVPLALAVPGQGFKAMTIDAGRPGFYALLPFAPLGFLLMRVPALYRRLWPIAQRAMAESEANLAEVGLADWHTYRLRWEPDQVTFAVDGRTVLVTPAAPRGPLSFVAWIDNAYAIATPRGQFAMGLVPTSDPEWLELESLEITEQAKP